MTLPEESFQLLETMRLESGAIVRLGRHLSRLRASADHFHYVWNGARLHEELARVAAAHAIGCWRVRLMLGRDGGSAIACAPYEERPRAVWRVAFASRPFDTASPLVAHKTTARHAYDNVRRERPELDDVLLWNEQGEVTEATIANVVIEIDGRRVTPPQRSGLLPGVLRGELLDRGEVAERVVTREDVTRARRLWLISSLRGWIDAVAE